MRKLATSLGAGGSLLLACCAVFADVTGPLAPGNNNNASPSLIEPNGAFGGYSVGQTSTDLAPISQSAWFTFYLSGFPGQYYSDPTEGFGYNWTPGTVVNNTDPWGTAWVTENDYSYDIGGVNDGTSTSGASNSLTDTTKSWTTNAWKFYTLYDVTSGKSCIVASNTATSVTCTGSQTISGAASHSYQIQERDSEQYLSVKQWNGSTTTEMRPFMMVENKGLSLQQGSPQLALSWMRAPGTPANGYGGFLIQDQAGNAITRTISPGEFILYGQGSNEALFQVLPPAGIAGEIRMGNSTNGLETRILEQCCGGSTNGFQIINYDQNSANPYNVITSNNSSGVQTETVGDSTSSTNVTNVQGGTVNLSGSTISIQGNTAAANATTGSVGEIWDANCPNVTSSASIAFASASPTVGTYSSPPWAASVNSNVPYGSFACPIYISATAPTGLSTNTTYWAVPINSTTFHVATSAANAMAGTFANTTGSTTTTTVVSSTYQTATTTVVSVGALKLTAGDWDCNMTGVFIPTSTTSVTLLQYGINSSATAQSTTIGQYGQWVTAANVINTTTTGNPNEAMGPVRISLSSATAEYADVNATFTASTMTEAGDFRCRRMH